MQVLPWHHYRADWNRALSTNDKQAFLDTLQAALSGGNVIHRDGLLIDGNEHGRSYNAMGQSDMGLSLIRAGRHWNMPELVEGGIQAMNVMRVDYENGGLRIADPETGAAWYVGKTSRDASDRGGTLNKHLYTARTFLTAAEELRALGRDGLADTYEKAGAAGFCKLVEGEIGPKLEDFFVTLPDGSASMSAWVHYGLNDADGSRPYYLRVDEKNANYHLYDMALIYQVAELLPRDFDFAPFQEHQLGEYSAFGGMLQIYLNKLDRGGLGQDTPTPFGQFSAVAEPYEAGLEPEMAMWFAEFLFETGPVGTAEADDLRGSAAQQILTGVAGADVIRAGAGADVVRGGLGADTLDGGTGHDTLQGGPGQDTFAFFAEAAGETDTIVDFGPGDQIALDDRFFTNFAEAGIDPRPVTEQQALTSLSLGKVHYDGESGTFLIDGAAIFVLDGAPALSWEDVVLF